MNMETQREGESRGYAVMVVPHVDPLNRTLTSRLAGLRYVPEKENQVRWEAPSMLTLPELQNGMHLHSGGKEAQPAERVSCYLATPNAICHT